MTDDIDDDAGLYSMSKHHREILRESRMFLSRNLQLRPIVDELMSSQIIHEHTEEEIFSSPIPSECVRKFLTQLPKLGPKAFDAFMDALKVTQHDHVYEHLKALNDNRRPQGRGPLPKDKIDLTQLTMSEEETVNKKMRNLSYDMKDGNVKVLIINNETFDHADLLRRDGAKADVKNLEDLFSVKLGFEVETHEDLSAHDMLFMVKGFSQRKTLAKADACIIVIMTHGEDGLVYGKDGRVVSVFDIVSQFGTDKCPNMVNKPKYFIFQSCRGQSKESIRDTTDAGPCPQTSQALAGIDPPSAEDEKKIPANEIPALADTLISYATIQTYVAWRNCEKGSWFIQSFVKVLTEDSGDLDVVTMLTKVTGDIINNFGERFKQLSETVTRLTKVFYLTPQKH